MSRALGETVSAREGMDGAREGTRLAREATDGPLAGKSDPAADDALIRLRRVLAGSVSSKDFEGGSSIGLLAGSSSVDLGSNVIVSPATRRPSRELDAHWPAKLRLLGPLAE